MSISMAMFSQCAEEAYRYSDQERVKVASVSCEHCTTLVFSSQNKLVISEKVSIRSMGLASSPEGVMMKM